MERRITCEKSPATSKFSNPREILHDKHVIYLLYSNTKHEIYPPFVSEMCVIWPLLCADPRGPCRKALSRGIKAGVVVAVGSLSTSKTNENGIFIAHALCVYI